MHCGPQRVALFMALLVLVLLCCNFLVMDVCVRMRDQHELRRSALTDLIRARNSITADHRKRTEDCKAALDERVKEGRYWFDPKNMMVDIQRTHKEGEDIIGEHQVIMDGLSVAESLDDVDWRVLVDLQISDGQRKFREIQRKFDVVEERIKGM